MTARGARLKPKPNPFLSPNLSLTIRSNHPYTFLSVANQHTARLSDFWQASVKFMIAPFPDPVLKRDRRRGSKGTPLAPFLRQFFGAYQRIGINNHINHPHLSAIKITGQTLNSFRTHPMVGFDCENLSPKGFLRSGWQRRKGRCEGSRDASLRMTEKKEA